jgi:L-amino acid N-acyltransferase YncA
MELRAATENDLPVINEICNHYVRTSPAIFQLEPFTMQERRAWLDAHDERHPVLVAVDGGEVVGWGALSRYHTRAGYHFTVEDSLYVRHDRHRLGVGRALLGELVQAAARHQHHAVVAMIDAEQEGSIGLHARLGFTRAGVLREIGYKFGGWRDVVFMQRLV